MSFTKNPSSPQANYEFHFDLPRVDLAPTTPANPTTMTDTSKANSTECTPTKDIANPILPSESTEPTAATAIKNIANPTAKTDSTGSAPTNDIAKPILPSHSAESTTFLPSGSTESTTAIDRQNAQNKTRDEIFSNLHLQPPRVPTPPLSAYLTHHPGMGQPKMPEASGAPPASGKEKGPYYLAKTLKHTSPWLIQSELNKRNWQVCMPGELDDALTSSDGKAHHVIEKVLGGASKERLAQAARDKGYLVAGKIRDHTPEKKTSTMTPLSEKEEEIRDVMQRLAVYALTPPGREQEWRNQPDITLEKRHLANYTAKGPGGSQATNVYYLVKREDRKEKSKTLVSGNHQSPYFACFPPAEKTANLGDGRKQSRPRTRRPAELKTEELPDDLKATSSGKHQSKLPNTDMAWCCASRHGTGVAAGFHAYNPATLKSCWACQTSRGASSITQDWSLPGGQLVAQVADGVQPDEFGALRVTDLDFFSVRGSTLTGSNVNKFGAIRTDIGKIAETQWLGLIYLTSANLKARVGEILATPARKPGNNEKALRQLVHRYKAMTAMAKTSGPGAQTSRKAPKPTKTTKNTKTTASSTIPAPSPPTSEPNEPAHIKADPDRTGKRDYDESDADGKSDRYPKKARLSREKISDDVGMKEETEEFGEILSFRNPGTYNVKQKVSSYGAKEDEEDLGDEEDYSLHYPSLDEWQHFPDCSGIDFKGFEEDDD